MELIRGTYQEVAWAYLGSASGDLYVRAYAMYTAQDIANNRSYVYYKATAYFSGSYIYDQQGNGSIGGTGVNTITGNVSNVSGEVTIAETEGWVKHELDGTKTINVVAKLNFPNWGWYATASGNATLPSLHKPPTIDTAEMVETNQDMINLNIPDTTIVQYLSQKQITLHGTAEDNATLTYRLEHNGTGYNIPASGYQVSNVFNTDYTQNNILIDANGKAIITQKLKDSMNGETTDYVNVEINSVIEKPNAIAYTKPVLDRTITGITRMSGVYSETLQRVANLTDNMAVLNLQGNIYKANDIIGNNNSLIAIGYKIWAVDDTEPANYTPITPAPTPDANGNISVEDLEISNIEFTSVYNYKIAIADNYGYGDAILDGMVSTGLSMWSEYEDKIDFYKPTRYKKEIFPNEYSDVDEIIVGRWRDGSDIYRKSFEVSVSGTETLINVSSLNIKIITKYEGTALTNNNGEIKPFPYHQDNETYSASYIRSNGNIRIKCSSSYLYGTVNLTIEYIKN